MEMIQKNFRLKVAERNWMVVYTRSNWEKKAAKLLIDQGITCFCPVIRTKRKWADRIKVVESPLFNSYIFVHANLYEQTLVQLTPGILNFVQYCNKPVIINDSEISRIHSIIKQYADVETVNINYINIGDNIKINNGPFLDCYGEVVQLQGKSVLMIMEQLGCALVVKVHHSQVQLNRTGTN